METVYKNPVTAHRALAKRGKNRHNAKQKHKHKWPNNDEYKKYSGYQPKTKK